MGSIVDSGLNEPLEVRDAARGGVFEQLEYHVSSAGVEEHAFRGVCGPHAVRDQSCQEDDDRLHASTCAGGDAVARVGEGSRGMSAPSGAETFLARSFQITPSTKK